MIMTSIIMGHECVQGTVWGGNQQGWEREKGEGGRVNIIERHYTHTHIHTHKDSIMQPNKCCLKKGKEE
jgi:hypothetical protein